MGTQRSMGRPVLAAAALVVLALLSPLALHAQPPTRALTIQPGIGFGTSDFGGLGLAIAGEIAVGSRLRLYGQWTDWEVFAGCGVADAPSECNTEAHLFEVGGRLGLAEGGRLAPYIGAGAGLYHRGFPEGVPTSNSALGSVTAGIDIRVGDPLTVRISIVHHEVFDDSLTELYDERVRVTGLLIGLGIVAR